MIAGCAFVLGGFVLNVFFDFVGEVVGKSHSGFNHCIKLLTVAIRHRHICIANVIIY